MTKQTAKPLKGMQDTPVPNKHKVTSVWHPIKNTRHAKQQEYKIHKHKKTKQNTHLIETVLKMTDRKVLAYKTIKSAIVHSLYFQNEGENMSVMGEVEDIKVFWKLLDSDLTCKVLRNQNFSLSNRKKS